MQKKKKRVARDMNLFYRFLVLFFLSVVVSSCASHSRHSVPVPISIACQRQILIDRLQKFGLQVIQLGDELRIIVSTQQLFAGNSPCLQMTCGRCLDEIIALLNLRKVYGIDVLAHTAPCGDFRASLCLAQQRAQAVVDYFIEHGLNTRLIIANACSGVSDRPLYLQPWNFQQGAVTVNNRGVRVYGDCQPSTNTAEKSSAQRMQSAECGRNRKKPGVCYFYSVEISTRLLQPEDSE